MNRPSGVSRIQNGSSDRTKSEEKSHNTPVLGIPIHVELQVASLVNTTLN